MQNCWVSGKQCHHDQMPHSVAPDLGLHCLLRPVCLNTYSKYGKLNKMHPLRNYPGSAPDTRDQHTIYIMYTVTVWSVSRFCFITGNDMQINKITVAAEQITSSGF